MKIIAVGMNYAQHNQELGHTQVLSLIHISEPTRP